MCFVRTKRVGKTISETSLTRQLLQHSFFKGNVLKSLWKKYFCLPRRLALKFPHSTLYHCYIRETLKSTKRDSLTPPLSPSYRHLTAWARNLSMTQEERCSAYSFLQKLKTHHLCSLWRPKATYIIFRRKRKGWTIGKLLKQMKSRTLFSRALKAYTIQRYTRVFLTFWSSWGELGLHCPVL